MKKLVLAFFLLIASLSSPELTGAQMSTLAPPAGRMGKAALLAKDASEFEIVSEHGKLFFTITTLGELALQGQWQALVLTPDHKKFKGPVVNFADPATTFTITVEHPIVFGVYTLVFKNIDAEFGNLLTLPYAAPIVVTNSYNTHVGRIYENDNFFLHPGDYFEILYRPFRGH